MKKNWIVALVVVLVLAGGAFFVINKSSTPTPVSAPDIIVTPEPVSETIKTEESTDSAITDASIKEFSVTGSAFKFDPKEIRVKKGDTVKITFKNASGVHDFTIDELNVATKQLTQGAQETVEFVASETGTFEYYCSVSNHRAQGMKGSLIVE